MWLSYPVAPVETSRRPRRLLRSEMECLMTAQQAPSVVTPDDTEQREQRVRPDPPFRAEIFADYAGLDVDEPETIAVGMALHYTSGVGWGPVYCVMRRTAGMDSLGAVAAAGVRMSVILDGSMTDALGLSPPKRGARAPGLATASHGLSPRRWHRPLSISALTRSRPSKSFPRFRENGGCAGPVQADVPKPENSGTLIETAIG